ncbi:MAG: 3-oxoacyl-ACP reductase FabG [Pseudomonadota bacterium]
MTEQIALVTGASRGIGKAIAEAMGAAGATVIGTATTDAGADKITQTFADADISGSGMRLDVSDKESVSQVIDAINDQFGAVSVLVNNAGITRDNLMMRMKDEEWDDIMATNLTSVFRVSKACLRGMIKARYGRIINIASVVGATGNAGQANYAAAKAGVIGFGKSLAKEVAARNITVNTIAPGFIASDMTDALSDGQREGILANVPAGRLGDPAEIASATVFLASPDASYITGHTLHINGGMFMS